MLFHPSLRLASLLVLVSPLFAYGCGDTVEPDGVGGTADEGAGGTTTDGSGGQLLGGSGPTGGTGTGGAATGGAGPASGGATSTCGNGAVDGDEQCDAGAGCSDECTLEACDSCRVAGCDYGGYRSCDDLAGADRDACESVLSCIRTTGCDADDVRACYCGSLTNFGTCFASISDNGANGQCKGAIESAAGSVSPIQIGTLFFNSVEPLGYAVQTALCDATTCRSECGYSAPGGTGGTSGTGGDSGSGGSSTGGTSTGGDSGTGGSGTGGNGTGGSGTGGSGTGGSGTGGSGTGGNGTGGSTGEPTCQECSEQWCPNPLNDFDASCTGNAQCDTYLSCVNQSSCAEEDVRDCYCGNVEFATCFAFDPAAPQGVCKTITNTMAGATVPLQVGIKYFDATNALGATNQVILCQQQYCASACGSEFGVP